jgi:hypothetical protein
MSSLGPTLKNIVKIEFDESSVQPLGHGLIVTPQSQRVRYN